MTTDWRAKLLELRAELEEVKETGAEASAVVELDQTKVGRLSRMDAMQAQAMAQASSDRRDQVLRGIDAALKRLDQEEFGYCLECGEPVNPKRLAFDPTVERCIDCANKAESS